MTGILVTEGSETRRKFVDGVISQQDKNVFTRPHCI